MKANSISTDLLQPRFSLPSLTNLSPNIQSRLLGQSRTLSAFSLLTQTEKQHMYLADQHGIDRKPLIEALIHSQSNEAPSKENQQKDQAWTYLSGQITKRDLIGYIDNNGTYHNGYLANCHYLFICAESLWKRESLWELLFQILEHNEYKVHSKWPLQPLNCKIILVGSSALYSVCYLEERLFARHFPLLGELVTEIPLNQCTELEYANWLQVLAQHANIQLAQSALAPLFNHSSKLADHQKQLSLLTVPLTQLMQQASVYSNAVELDAKAIEKALHQQIQRHNASQEFSAQSFDDNFINLPTQGTMIGQINGLTVLDTAEYTYGEPARITVSVHYGDGEVADIERKSELGGNIHAKGLMILSSCLYRIFGKDAPLHLNANIVFEQSYQEIDGDSASLAEYCALVSAIAEQPIDQGIAATGAIDQFGQVQAIGGVNEKIEGFFQLCQRRGLTGEQGVILPKSNVQQLNLHPDVIQAVKQQKFHLYQVEHMDEAVEILMKKPAGVRDEQGQFEGNSLYGLVQTRLEGLAGYGEEESSFLAKLLAKFQFSS